MVNMNGRETVIQELIESIDDMLAVIEEQDSVESDFALVREVADQLREEIIALQEE